jgi:hypothetical protein
VTTDMNEILLNREDEQNTSTYFSLSQSFQSSQPQFHSHSRSHSQSPLNKRFIRSLQQILENAKQIIAKHKIVCEIFHQKLEENPKQMIMSQSLFTFHSQQLRQREVLLQLKETSPLSASLHSPKEILQKIKTKYNIDNIYSEVFHEVIFLSLSLSLSLTHIHTLSFSLVLLYLYLFC